MRREGSVTITFSLCFLVLLSFVFAMLESARVGAAAAACRRYADISAEMVFSSYVTPLADRYGLFVLENSDENKDRFQRYMEMNMGGFSGKQFGISGEISDISVTGTRSLADDQYSYLLKQIERYELYRFGEEAMEKLRSGNDIQMDSRAEEISGNFSEALTLNGEALEKAIEQEEEAASSENTESGESVHEENDSVHESDYKDPRKGISSWLKSGLVYLAAGDRQISGKSIDTGDCSYHTERQKKAGFSYDFQDFRKAADDLDGDTFSEDLRIGLRDQGEFVIVNFYLEDVFENFLDAESREGRKERDYGTVLDYELEFILNGMDSDKENLENTFTSLAMLRMLSNLVYLYTYGYDDTALEQAAMSLAASAIPVAGQLIKLLLMLCWAAAESVVDISALVDGKKVPLIKDRLSWNLTLESLGKIASEGGTAGKYVKCGERGLDYSGYLRILLLLTPSQKKIIRALQLMEKNIRSCSGYESFSFNRSIIEADFSARLLIRPYYWKGLPGIGLTGIQKRLSVVYGY